MTWTLWIGRGCSTRTGLPAARAIWRLTGDAESLIAPLLKKITSTPPGPRWAEALTLLAGIGPAARGSLPELRAVAEHALAVFHELGDRLGAGFALCNLAEVSRAAGDYRQAVDQHRQAIEVFRQAGGVTGAVASHRSALTAATSYGDRIEQARALHGLGRAMSTLDDPDTTRPPQPGPLPLRRARPRRSRAGPRRAGQARLIAMVHGLILAHHGHQATFRRAPAPAR